MFKGQEYESVIAGLNVTTPSAAGIASKIKSPSALSTGIPQIEIPFFSLATHNKGVSINLGLSYHPNNTLMESKASDVGLGWTMVGNNNVIYRELNTLTGVPLHNYHFNFLGRGGSFQFYKTGSNAFSLTKITENKYKISVTETSPNLYKFKIIDENGISYYFETLDNSYYPDTIQGKYISFTGAYYLTKIEDAAGNELVSYEYLQDAYTMQAFSGPFTARSLKVSKIISRDFGSIHFSYTFNSTDRTSSRDPFRLDTVELKNSAGKQIKKYALQFQDNVYTYPYGFIDQGPNLGCNYSINQYKRQLVNILEYGSGASYETTEIKYSGYFGILNFNDTSWSEYPAINNIKKCFPKEYENPKYLALGLLRSIQYPNGTEVKYTFEPNQYYVDKSFPDYQSYAPPYEVKDRDAQYFENIASIPFDYHNTDGQPQLGMFTLPSNPDEQGGYSYLFIDTEVQELYTDSPFQPSNGNYVVNINFNSGVSGLDGHKKYPSGSNSFVISGSGGRGVITIKRIRYKTLPLKNYSTGKGVRIKKIEYLENNTVNNTLTRTYDYPMFDGSNATSGFLNNIENVQTVVYKNVKETSGQNLGYSKYYYRTLFDKVEPQQSNPGDSLILVGNELRYANILANGLLEKKEIYDNLNNLVQKDTIISKMISLDNSQINVEGYYYGVSVQALRNGLINNQKTISTAYTSSGNYVNTSEITRDVNDFNIVHQKNIGSDGNITETFLTYPWSKRTTDPKLWNANITTVPLSVESKRDGVTLSKSETKFDNASHFYPTSQLSFFPDNLSQSLKNASFDIYDDKGNLVQFTAFPDVGSIGVPTTIIYGYNKTLPIAKIQGAKLSDIPASMITAIVNASNEDAAATAAQEAAKEQALIDALNSFRSNGMLQNFMVTCYTYNPLVGLTTMIPPNGMMEFYQYDAFNRLLKVLDVNGNTVKEHQYNYKH
ncbi:hypothetical protein EG349_20060 (plasmid) [Chryseobacterium shandongense]|jgi:hypothetical protein|uniref:RHS repeat-associated core domain-containing protein n=2 Tax=Chryseobacterium shandongense TaxID=1493872 RepID=A0AAD0YFB3_9FLAO|nr:hypothetical protein EG349_20060 [Chryseobacterium shandongense]AZA98030.1 hypothetical protein EG353_20805 [Chryseobacterium shandongense]